MITVVRIAAGCTVVFRQMAVCQDHAAGGFFDCSDFFFWELAEVEGIAADENAVAAEALRHFLQNCAIALVIEIEYDLAAVRIYKLFDVFHSANVA